MSDVNSMIVTARQLEDLHKSNGSNGHVTLPYRARLTPLAHDWLRQRNVQLGYADVETTSTAVAPQPPLAASQAPASTGPGSTLWWCDGPCGPAKAALMSQSKESSLSELAMTSDPNHLIDAIKILAQSIKSGRASHGVLLVSQGASAIVYANRCPSLRAILGTCLESVDQGVQQLAANVLVIEHPHKTLAQVKNLLARFLRGANQRETSDKVKHQLQELATCE
jgi:ribose 5-phosphate isomerase RpiB